MSQHDDDTLAHFTTAPSTVPALADAQNLSKEVAARRVRAMVEAGKLESCGKEDRDGKGIRGQRPVLYRLVA